MLRVQANQVGIHTTLRRSRTTKQNNRPMAFAFLSPRVNAALAQRVVVNRS